MTGSIHALYRYPASKIETGIDPFTMVALFCGAGLLVSLIFVAYGVDLRLDFF